MQPHPLTRGAQLIGRVTIWLAVSAVVTVLSTWALAAWGPTKVLPFSGSLEQTTDDWPVPLPSKLRDKMDRASTPGPRGGIVMDRYWYGYQPAERSPDETKWCSTSAYAVSSGYITSLFGPGKAAIAMTAHRVGWPCRAMGYASIWADGQSSFDEPLKEGWALPKLAPRRLPFMPLWPGFALNTLFYAAIAWGLWQVPFAIRRRRRRRTNKCLKCGYDRAGGAGAVCPECGSGRSRV